MQDGNLNEANREKKRKGMQRAEAQYLRFLRTRENANNFTTIKIIGKGAFGEVKLVQKKTDGKIYALKSLVKSEMVRKDKVETLLNLILETESMADTCCSLNVISLPMFVQSVTFWQSRTVLGLSSSTTPFKILLSYTC